MVMQESTSAFQMVEQFRCLQAQLRDRWHTVELFDSSDADIIVVPSSALTSASC